MNENFERPPTPLEELRKWILEEYGPREHDGTLSDLELVLLKQQRTYFKNQDRFQFE